MSIASSVASSVAKSVASSVGVGGGIAQYPCLTLNGTTDVVNCGDTAGVTFGDGAGNDSPFSVSAKIKLTSAGMVVSKSNGVYEWSFGFSSGKLSLYLCDSALASYVGRRYNTVLGTGDYSVLATYDGSKALSGLKLYLDGARVDDASDVGGTYGGMSNTAATLKLGAATVFGTAFGGSIFDVRIYSTELTADNALWLDDYSSGTKPSSASLIRHYKCDDGSGTTVADSTAAANDGTLTTGDVVTAWATTQTVYDPDGTP